MGEIDYKVKLQGSDGKDYVVSMEGLKEDLDNERSWDEKVGWTPVTKSLREDVNNLQNSLLKNILIPIAKEAVIRFLREHPNVETRNFYAPKEWLGKETLNAWHYAKEQLEAEGVIVSVSHGKGKNRTWNILEATQ